MQQLSKNLLLVAVALGCLLAATEAGSCGGCMENKVACVNETHYRVCINHSPIEGGGILPCGSGRICTSLREPCWLSFEGDGVEPACKQSNIDCPSCDGSQLFVCTSRTTFQMCNGTQLSPEINPCPGDTVCSINSGNFCVKKCALPNGIYECSRDAP